MSLLEFWRQNAAGIYPVFTGIAAAAACLSALFSFLAIRATKRLAEARLIFEFKERYNSLEMGEALRELAEFRQQHGKRFVDEWIALNKKQRNRALELNGYRRLVSGYYSDISFLLNGQYLSERAVKLLLLERGINVFVHIVVPFEKKAIKNWDYSIYDRLIGLKSHDDQFVSYSVYRLRSRRVP